MTSIDSNHPCNTLSPQKGEGEMTNGGFYTWGLEGIIKKEEYRLG